MPVVPVGDVKDTYVGSYVYNKTLSGLPTTISLPCTFSKTVGRQEKSTSPRIVIKGTKWSLAHSYRRTAYEVEILGGKCVRRLESAGSPGNYYYGTLTTGVSTNNFGRVITSRAVSPYQSEWGAVREIDTNRRNRLITETILKAGARKASLGEALAESGKTVNHLAHTASSLVKALLAARKGNWAGVAKALGTSKKKLKSGDSVSSRWLEYSYAWMPLINDIYDTHKVFKEGLKRPQVIRAMRRLRETYNLEANSTDVRSNRVKVMGNAESSAQCIAHWRIDDPTINYLEQLGLINPVEIAWALVPFSFVLDWCIPVQNYLEALTATLGMTFIDGCLTHRVVTNCTTTIEDDVQFGNLSNGELVSSSPFYRVSSKGVLRRPVVITEPLLYYKSPFSTNHVISAIALLRQLSKR